MTRLTHLRRALGVAVGIAGLVCSGFGQTANPAPAPSTPTPTTPTTPTLPGGGGRPTNPGQQQPSSPFPNQNQIEMQQMQRPIFLSGKVMLDSGTPPLESVVIQRVCNGNPRAEAYTDSKGRFSFQLGQNNGMMQDASMSSSSGLDGFGGGGRQSGAFGQNAGVSERDLIGCEVRASLAGYRSDLIPLTGRRSLDNPDLGTIVLHRMGNVEGVTVSASSLNAPKDAKKAFEKGGNLLRKKKIAEGRKELEKAVALYPNYAAAWFDLGRAKEVQNDIEGARAAYAQALTIDAKFLYPYRQLVGLYVKEQKWQEVADTSGKLIRLDPVDFPDMHYYNAVSNYFLKNFDVAEKSIREVQKLDSQNKMPKASKLLGAILVEKQDYAGAAVQIKKYLSFLPAGQDDEQAKQELVEIERVAGVPQQ